MAAIDRCRPETCQTADHRAGDISPSLLPTENQPADLADRGQAASNSDMKQPDTPWLHDTAVTLVSQRSLIGTLHRSRALLTILFANIRSRRHFSRGMSQRRNPVRQA